MLFHLRVRSQRVFKSVLVRSGRDGSKRHKQMVSVWIVKGSQPHEREWLLVSLHSWWAQKKVKWKLGWKNVKTSKPLLASVLQARLDDGPQISRLRIDIWSYKQADSEPGAASQTVMMVISTVSKNVCFMLHMRDKRQTMTESSKIVSLFIES